MSNPTQEPRRREIPAAEIPAAEIPVAEIPVAALAHAGGRRPVDRGDLADGAAAAGGNRRGASGLGGGIPGSIPMVQHLTLWAALLGAALASRTDRHLALSTTNFLPPSWAGPIRILTSAVAVAVTSSLVVASLDLVGIEREFGEVFAWGIPLWVALAIMPLSFTVITGRLIARGSKTPRGRGLIALGLLVPLAFGWIPASRRVESGDAPAGGDPGGDGAGHADFHGHRRSGAAAVLGRRHSGQRRAR